MKLCTKCEQTKPFEEFALSRANPDGYQYWCRDCKKIADDTNYRKNESRRTRIRLANDTNVKARLTWLEQYKRERGCADCGETDPVVLDFDHLDDKIDNVSTMARNGCSWDKIRAEVAKCEVVCANDHRRRTKSRR